jgi:hypothetical protein
MAELFTPCCVLAFFSIKESVFSGITLSSLIQSFIDAGNFFDPLAPESVIQMEN